LNVENVCLGDVSSTAVCAEAKEECPVAGGGALCTGFPCFCLLLYSTLADFNQTKTHVAAPEDVTSNIHLTL